MFRTRRSTAVALAVTALAAPVLMLAACSGSSESSASSAVAPRPGLAGGGSAAASASAAGDAELAPQAVPRAQATAGQAAAGQAAAGQAAAGAGQSVALVQARVVRTAEVVVQVQQLATSAARVRAAALGLGGVVASEVTTFAETGGTPATGPAASGATGASPDLSSLDGAASDSTGPGTRAAIPGESVIVLRVPVNSLDSAVDKISAIGKELSRSTASQDVTADLADLGSRVKTQQASVDRIRVLLARATSMQDIVLLESQLSTREADLEALQARQASLADRADLSTLTVTLRTPEVVATQPVKDDGGFLSGLKSGWHAVAASTTVVLTVLGALLPVLVAVGVIGWPVYLLIRRRTGARASAGAAATGAAASTGPTGPAPAQQP